MIQLVKRVARLPKSLLTIVRRLGDLEARMSLVDGRSSLNAERNVHTHASLQNLAEDVERLQKQVRALKNERTKHNNQAEGS